MARADFYLIDKPRFRDDPLLLVCELARRAFEARIPTVILARDAAQAEALDEKLWEFDPDAYVPHQIAGDEEDEATPVLIVPPELEAPRRALAINLREDCATGFETVKEVVAAAESERAGSRARWTAYRRAGVEVRKFDM